MNENFKIMKPAMKEFKQKVYLCLGNPIVFKFLIKLNFFDEAMDIGNYKLVKNIKREGIEKIQAYLKTKGKRIYIFIKTKYTNSKVQENVIQLQFSKNCETNEIKCGSFEFIESDCKQYIE